MQEKKLRNNLIQSRNVLEGTSGPEGWRRVECIFLKFRGRKSHDRTAQEITYYHLGVNLSTIWHHGV
jgi:hypothetical protein